MKNPVKAIEVTGTIDARHRLVLDEPLPIEGPARVRVVILVSENAEISEQEWLKAADSNPAFDFLKDSAEDIYTPTDGRPFHDKG